MGEVQKEDTMVVVKPNRDSKVHDLWEDPPVEHVEDWLQTVMDVIMEGEQTLWGKERDYLRPSSSGDICERSITFGLFGHNSPVDASVKRIFRIGNKIEEAIVEVLREAGVLVEAQGKIKLDGPEFHGFYDVIIAKTPKGERLLGEIKSIKQEKFNKLPKPTTNPAANVRNLIDAGQRGYMCQCQLYFKGTDTKLGFILFECKNTGRQAIFWIAPYPLLMEEIVRIGSLALSYKERRVIAPIPAERHPEKKRDPGCQWCNAKYLCVRVDPGEVHIDVVRKVDLELRGSK